MIEVITHILV